jgi:uncharacterized protein YgiM (DUF1202 family)
MMTRGTTVPVALLSRAAAALVCCACTLHAASAVLSGLDIVGSARGVALTLRADAPFPVKLEEKPFSKNAGTVLVAVHCTDVIYGLEDFEFTSFPAGCPVSRIAVSESPAGNSIDLVLAVAGSLDRPAVAKQKDAKWIILLSHESAPDFSWSAAPQPKPAAVPAKQMPSAKQPGESRLTDISVLVRDKVELLTFSFDGPTAMRLKRDQDNLVVLFVNATSGLPITRVSPPNDPTSVIDLKQIAHGGTLWLGASVSMAQPALHSALMQAFADRLVIYTVRDSLQSLSLWSAAKGQSVQYNFVELPRFDVDIEGMKKKAVTDLSTDLPRAKTFAIREEEAARAVPTAAAPDVAPAMAPAASAAAPVAPRAPAVVRFIVTKDNVNLRTEASAGSAVVSKLAAGTVATLVAKKPEWVKVRTGDTAGWVSAAMTADSARAPKAVLDNIDRLVRARLAREKAAEEKAARGQAAKEKAQQEKLAKQKLAADREAQKKADKESRAAARDSLVRYTAAAQESVQTVKNVIARKLVEYHVYGRDPFLPLSEDEDTKVQNVEDLTLVGILYDQSDRIALFETSKGREKALALRENDPVQNGYVLRIQPDKVLFLLNELGISRTYALKLTREQEK